MSYARFGWWESDVYIFATTIDGREVIECCGCHVNDGASITCDGPQEMLDHVRGHREFGDHVPSDVDERLQWEIDHPDEEYRTDVVISADELMAEVERMQTLALRYLSGEEA